MVSPWWQCIWLKITRSITLTFITATINSSRSKITNDFWYAFSASIMIYYTMYATCIQFYWCHGQQIAKRDSILLPRCKIKVRRTGARDKLLYGNFNKGKWVVADSLNSSDVCLWGHVLNGTCLAICRLLSKSLKIRLTCYTFVHLLEIQVKIKYNDKINRSVRFSTPQSLK